MRRDEPPRTMNNGTEPPTRTMNVLFDIVILREISSAVISWWIHTRGSGGGFRPHKFMERPGTGELGMTLSESKEAEVYFNLYASSSSGDRAVSGSGLLQSISQMKIGAVLPLGVGGREAG